MWDWLFRKNEGERQEPKSQILLEIVGAMNLTPTRQGGAAPAVIDAFCLVKVGSHEVHRTKVIPDDPNPIWTIKTKSLCLVEVPGDHTSKPHQETVSDDKHPIEIALEVHSGSRHLGSVRVPFGDLVEGRGERIEYDLQPAKDISWKRATLALRYRPATLADLVFLGKLHDDHHHGNLNNATNNSSCSTQEFKASDINFHAVRGKFIFQQDHKKGKNDEDLYRVMPYPDPDRPASETRWMTREQMHEEALKPSKKWITAGSGAVGTLYIEILGCDDLPKLDLNINDDTDTFVAVAFEDNMVRTEVLWDDLNPRWMPWTGRAFAFRIRHPTSILMLAAFDYDETPVDFHDPIGRVAINTVNFLHNTEYLLYYKLYHDPRQEDEVSRGTIMIRLRLEWNDCSEALKMTFSAPPRFIINVDNLKSFQVLRYLAQGAVDMESPSVSSVKLYWKEIVSYWMKYCYVLDVIFETLLWRGRLQITKENDIWFPIHSIALFLAVTLSIEFPQKMGAIVFFAIAYILLAINYHASRHPNPWKRVRRCDDTQKMMLLGFSELRQTIQPGDGFEAAGVLERLDSAKERRIANLLLHLLYFALKVYRIYSKTAESGFKITTELKDWSFLNGRLYYIHMVLKYTCKYIRLFRNFVNWRGYTTDVFTTYCILIGTAWFLFPVHLCVVWILRIVAWGVTGPWMKIVDVLWVHSWYRTKRELLEQLEAGQEIEPDLPDLDSLLASEVFIKMGYVGRVQAENASKLRDMREHIFGYYSEKLPAFDNSRYPSVPLKESVAKPIDDFQFTTAYHVPSQQLRGHMILSREDETIFTTIEADKKEN